MRASGVQCTVAEYPPPRPSCEFVLLLYYRYRFESLSFIRFGGYRSHLRLHDAFVLAPRDGLYILLLLARTFFFYYHHYVLFIMCCCIVAHHCWLITLPHPPSCNGRPSVAHQQPPASFHICWNAFISGTSLHTPHGTNGETLANSIRWTKPGLEP